jgi:hypothetical protein
MTITLPYTTTDTYSSFQPFAYNFDPGQRLSTTANSVATAYLNWRANDSRNSYDPEGWAGANPGYLGVNFKIGADTHYAWMQITRNPTTGSAVVVDWAYESLPDEGIVVPEPSTDAMSMTVLAMGGAAVLARRRKLRAEREQASA